MATSRIGRKPVAVPKNVDIKIQGHDIHVKGPKGQMNISIHRSVLAQFEDGIVKFRPNADAGYCRSGSGLKLKNSIVATERAKFANNIKGITEGFERKLLLVGVGFRAQAKGHELNLSIGFSHPVVIRAPEGVTIETPSQTEIVVKGTDKHLVGHVASKIRSARPPELYKGKGIRYANEVIVLKETKKK
ncbi:MAG TPA: 50S ribosomal protein L6 [Gammaproteobacteria bacterium]|nr:50S ribosomal protein L6 [Gammaproteobacteria bacterium]